MIQHLPEEHKAIALLFMNGAAEIVHKMQIDGILNSLLVLAQILVAIGTALWFFRRARGAALDNKAKEHALEKDDPDA